MDVQELKARVVAWLRTPQGTGLGLAAVIGFVLSGIVLLAFDPSPNPGPTSSGGVPVADSDDEIVAYLKQARAHADEGDLEAAHRLLQAIPESSPQRESEAYRSLEDAWADWMFDRASRTDDADEKASLLNTVSETTTVSPAKRQKAAEMALALHPAPIGSSGDQADAGRPNPQKDALVTKMRNGNATAAELRMLIALCNEEGDRQCRDIAFVRWKALTQN